MIFGDFFEFVFFLEMEFQKEFFILNLLNEMLFTFELEVWYPGLNELPHKYEGF